MTIRYYTRLFMLVLALSALIPSVAQATNLLVNGSFETWSGGYTPGNQPDRIFNDLSLVVPGWDFAIGLSSDIYRDLNASGAQSSYYDAADGDYLAASGSFTSVNEGITQAFAVTPATQYEVTFLMAPGGLNYSGAWIECADISSGWLVEVTGAVAVAVSQNFGNDLSHFDKFGVTNPLQWTAQSLLFTSDGAGGTVTLAFTAQGDDTHVFIDDVAVQIYEPTPAADFSWGGIKGMFR